MKEEGTSRGRGDKKKKWSFWICLLKEHSRMMKEIRTEGLREGGGAWLETTVEDVQGDLRNDEIPTAE